MHCGYCGSDLTGRRKGTKYCDGTCRARACLDRKRVGVVTTSGGSTARLNVKTNPKQSTGQRVRRQNGEHVYLLPDEMHALVEGKMLCPPWMRAVDKIAKAKKRIERRS